MGRIRDAIEELIRDQEEFERRLQVVEATLQNIPCMEEKNNGQFYPSGQTASQGC